MSPRFQNSEDQRRHYGLRRHPQTFYLIHYAERRTVYWSRGLQSRWWTCGDAPAGQIAAGSEGAARVSACSYCMCCIAFCIG
jgi:hypothetical protein